VATDAIRSSVASKRSCAKGSAVLTREERVVCELRYDYVAQRTPGRMAPQGKI
jgi:hypothetical protein